MATENKDFKVKNGLIVGGPTNLVNYSSGSPSNPFIGQLWIDSEGELPEPEPDTYLSLVAASALYLSIVDAENTYLPISASSNFGGGPSGEYDPIGSASAAEFNAKAYADSLSVNYDLIGSASAAEFNAKAYSDSLAVNYDSIGSASAQRILAQEYADSLAVNYEPIGSASAAASFAEFYANLYSDSLAANYDAVGSASVAEFNAKNYANSLSSNYDSAGSASAAQTAAQNYADTQIFNLVDSAPETLNTLNELAAALGDDPNFATSTASALGQRLTIANASATYLTKVDASTTYLPISASSTLGGGAVVEMSPTEPPDPEDGTLWVDTDSDIEILNVNDYLRKDSASTIYLPISGSINWSNIISKPDLLRTDTASATYATKLSPTITGNLTMNTGAPALFYDSVGILGGRILSNFTYLYIQGGSDSGDTDAEVRISRTGTTSTSISQFNVYADTTTFSGRVVAPLSTNPQTGTSYTLVLTDQGKAIEMNNANPNIVVVPLESSVAFPVGTIIDIFQTGAGQTTASSVSGVTINARPGFKLSGQWATATLIKRATNTWLLTGSLSS